ncbi:MAG: hypothetical protein MJE68_05610 [Proteobacteria bacterium]|nr:hypothetical protein [Pseudomonadota bacterium]
MNSLNASQMRYIVAVMVKSTNTLQWRKKTFWSRGAGGREISLGRGAKPPIEFCACMQIKDFSKRAKKWRNDTWPKDSYYGGEGRPSSYLMSLLVVLAYEEATPTKKPHE